MEERNVKSRIAAIAVVLSTAACAGGGSPGTPGPDAALAYGVAPASPLIYETADTMTIDMDIAGTPVQVSARADATMEAAFTRAGDALQAEIRYTAMSGSFANSMGPSIPISNADIPDVATLRVERNGEVSGVELPEASEAFRQIFGAESSYRRLFVRLPARVVQPGEMWTDTISTTEDVGGMTSEITQIVTSTLTGDTLVDGRRLRVITSDITGTTRIAGMNQGMEIRQLLNGSCTWRHRRADRDRYRTGLNGASRHGNDGTADPDELEVGNPAAGRVNVNRPGRSPARPHPGRRRASRRRGSHRPGTRTGT
jgi:hypothetical protein